MEVINSLSELYKLSYMTGVSLGSFDGIHKGHLKLLRTLIENCNKKNLKSVVYTFSNHPREIINFKNPPKLIINNRQKMDLFSKIGIDILVMVNFDTFHKNISARDFVEKILLEKLNMKSIAVGADCHFGRKAEGDIALLTEFATQYNFDLTVVPPLKMKNEIVSSTSIRNSLSEGLIEKANLFLGRKYSIIGKVIKGKQVGAQFGFPTANISLDSNLCLPKPGVYITTSKVDEKIYNSITNVGFNPTFNQKNYNVETYILDFNKDIYDKEVEVEFYHRIRDEKKFNNVEELYIQIDKDTNYCKKFFQSLSL